MSQKLGGLYTKLGKCFEILESYESIAKLLGSHAQKLEANQCLETSDRLSLENILHAQLFIVQGHKRKVQMLLKSCDFAAQMVVQPILQGKHSHIVLNDSLLTERTAIRTARLA
jgi:hypothetical protein